MIFSLMHTYRLSLFLVIFFLTGSQLWASIVISEDKKSFKYYCNEYLEMEWYLNYSLSVDKLCDNKRYEDFGDKNRCIYKNKETVFIERVFTILLTEKENTTVYDPEKIAFIVNLRDSNDPDGFNADSLFVFQNKSYEVYGEINMYAFNLPRLHKIKDALDCKCMFKSSESNESVTGFIKCTSFQKELTRESVSDASFISPLSSIYTSCKNISINTCYKYILKESNDKKVVFFFSYERI